MPEEIVLLPCMNSFGETGIYRQKRKTKNLTDGTWMFMSVKNTQTYAPVIGGQLDR